MEICPWGALGANRWEWYDRIYMAIGAKMILSRFVLAVLLTVVFVSFSYIPSVFASFEHRDHYPDAVSPSTPRHFKVNVGDRDADGRVVMKFSWSPARDGRRGTGVDSYLVYTRSDDFSFDPTPHVVIGTRLKQEFFFEGATLCFSVAAHDRAGNVSLPSREQCVEL